MPFFSIIIRGVPMAKYWLPIWQNLQYQKLVFFEIVQVHIRIY